MGNLVLSLHTGPSTPFWSEEGGLTRGDEEDPPRSIWHKFFEKKGSRLVYEKKEGAERRNEKKSGGRMIEGAEKMERSWVEGKVGE